MGLFFGIVQQKISSAPILTVSPATMYFNSNGTPVGASTITITANVSWTATANDTWFSINKNSGTGNDTIDVSCDSYNGVSDRSSTVTITDGTINRTVTIYQYGIS